MQQGEKILCRGNEPLSASSEDYLKAVYYFSQKTPTIQSADIAAFLGVTKPSVHHAMEVLQKAGLIIKPLYGEISMTERGRRQAQTIVCKHSLLKRLLVSIKIDEETAEQDACRIEHVISDETMFHLLCHFKKDQSHENNQICTACWNESEERKCMLARDGLCWAC